MANAQSGWRRRTPVAGRRGRVVVAFTDDEWSRVQAHASATAWSAGAYIARAALADPGSAGTSRLEPQRWGVALRTVMRAYRQLHGAARNLNQVAAGLNRVLAEHDPPAEASRADLADVQAAIADLPAARLVAFRAEF